MGDSPGACRDLERCRAFARAAEEGAGDTTRKTWQSAPLVHGGLDCRPCADDADADGTARAPRDAGRKPCLL